MEFDKDAPASDEQRRLAETKKLTLEPLHGDIAPEAISDSEIAARHLIEPAVSNMTNDTEQNSASVRPSKSMLSTPMTNTLKRRFFILATVILLVAAGFALSALFFATR